MLYSRISKNYYQFWNDTLSRVISKDLVDGKRKQLLNKLMTLIKTKEDREEFVGLISEAFQQVMVPALENMEERLRNDLASKEELHEVKMKVDSIDRKLDAVQERLDNHNERLEALEKIHPKGKHSFMPA